MSKVYKLIGTIAKVSRYARGIDRSCTIMTPKGNNYDVCFSSNIFSNFNEDDIIECRVTKEGDFYRCDTVPLVTLHYDRETIENGFVRALKGTGFGKKRASEVYDVIKRLAADSNFTLDYYNSQSRDVKMTEEVVGVDGVILYLTSCVTARKDSERILEEETKLNNRQVKQLLYWWYKNRLIRRLHLLGLNNKEIQKCRLNGDEIYQVCIINPYKLAPVPMEKCKTIMDLHCNEITAEHLRCGEILRRVYNNSENRSWVCTPLNFVKTEFKDYSAHYSKLNQEYNLVLDSENLYMTYNLEVEMFITETIDKLITDTATTAREKSTERQLNVDAKDLTFNYSIPTYTEEQKTAINGAINSSICIITGGGGTGKCLSPNTKIVMYDGRIKYITDIIIGDKVMGDDSTERNVLGICRGLAPMFKINVDKGKSFTCNGPHVMTLKGCDVKILPPDHKNNKNLYSVLFTVRGIVKNKLFKTLEQAEKFKSEFKEPADIYDIPLHDIMKLPIKTQNKLKLVHKPIELQSKPVPVDPYLMGYLLGDTSESEVKNDACTDMGFNIRRGRFNNIPDLYLYNDIKKRVHLLAGITDHYGTIKEYKAIIPKKCDINISDMVYLIQSLGFTCEVKEDNIAFFGESLMNIIKTRTMVPNYINVSKFKIVPVGLEDYAGFELDGNGRFMLEDFTITHNSTICKDICNSYKARGIEFAACAFTGKAVSRLNKSIGSGTAKTMDYMIKVASPEIKFSVLLIDESSMVTTELMYRFKKAFPHDFSIIFVGDCNQLPPIGWGFLMKQLMLSRRVPVYTLTQNQRLVKRQLYIGEPVESDTSLDPASVSFERTLLTNSNRLIDPERNYSHPIEFETGGGFHEVDGNLADIQAYLEQLKASFDMDSITIISPYNEYIGTINQTFQRIFLNDQKGGIDRTGTVWKVKDRVMMLKNNYEIGVMNGEEGKVIDVTTEGVVVTFDNKKNEQKSHLFKFFSSSCSDENDYKISSFMEDEEIILKGELVVTMIQHSFCLSVHNSQGSEYENVVLFLPDKRDKKGKTSSFLNINLLYTAITRTRGSIWIVTRPRVLGEISMNKLPTRIENLAKRLLNLKNDELEDVLKDHVSAKIVENNTREEQENDFYEPDWD